MTPAASAAPTGQAAQAAGATALATMVEIQPLEIEQPERAEQRGGTNPEPRPAAPPAARSSSVVPRPASRREGAPAPARRETPAHTGLERKAAGASRTDEPISPTAAIAASVIRARRARMAQPEAVAQVVDALAEHVVEAPAHDVEAEARPSRKELRQERKRAEAAERTAAHDARLAERAAAEEAKKAERIARADAKEAARVAKARAKESGVRLSRRDRRVERMGRTLALRPGETITLAVDGRSGLARATLMITRYRVAVVWRSRRMRARWIPLEEVTELNTAWRGAPTIHVEATIEHLTFSHRSEAKMSDVAELLDAEVRAARAAGGQRHEASITQEWCDRAGETFEDSLGRIRLWIRRHPIFTVSWLFAVGVVSLLTSTGRMQ